VKAVLTIITKLADRTINGELLKHLAKTSNDEQPGIRTNTTICMGKIARSLGPNTRQKVLVAAFSRSLRDPFIHARNAALLALAATSDLFSEDDCATKLLPSICPSLVDKEKLVRDQANKTFDAYVTRIRKYSTTLPDTLLPPPATATANGVPPRMGTPQNDSAGWAGWAISSFTNKLGTASGDMQSKATNLARPASIERSSSVPATTNPRSLAPSASASTLHRQAVTGTSTPVLTETPPEKFFTDAAADDEDIDEAWGEMNEESFFDAPSEIKAPPVSFDDGGEPDFEGWLNAQAQAKSKAPLPKGLTKSTANGSGNGSARGGVTRTTTTGSVGSGLGAKKLATTVSKPKAKVGKVFSTKPEEGAEDDWGDAWD